MVFHQQAAVVAHSLGLGNSICADSGQPFTFGSSFRTGDEVTINSPLSGAGSTFGQMIFYDGFVVEDRSVILGSPTANVVMGGNVDIGPGAVVIGSSIAAGLNRDPRAYVADSTLPANTTIPAGAIVIGNVVRGFIQW